MKSEKTKLIADALDLPLINKRAKMVGLYGAPKFEEIVFIRRADDSIEQMEEHDLDYAEEVSEDIEVMRVDSDVVQFIEDSSEKNPENYEKRPYVGVDNGEAEAIAFMAHRSGDLQIEVLMQYTTLIQGGMRPGPAAYAALLSYDISVEEA